MFDVYTNLWKIKNLNSLFSKASYKSLECYKSIISHFSRLSKNGDNNSNNVINEWFLNLFTNFNKNNLENPTK